MSKLVLGKGLGALIPGDESAGAAAINYKMVPLDQIAPNPMQPRRDFNEERLRELADSFKQNGIMQPLVVKKTDDGFAVVAGERRLRAARMAGLESVPVVVLEELDNARMLEMALVENIQRENLNPLELAEAYRRLIEECRLTQNRLAERVKPVGGFKKLFSEKARYSLARRESGKLIKTLFGRQIGGFAHGPFTLEARGHFLLDLEKRAHQRHRLRQRHLQRDPHGRHGPQLLGTRRTDPELDDRLQRPSGRRTL